MLRPILEKRDTNLRQAVLIERRIAISLWRLATGNAYRCVCEAFSVGASTCKLNNFHLCNAIAEMAENFIKFPKTRLETENAIEKFRLSEDSKIAMVVGSLDGTHIPILAPDNDNKVDFF